MKYIILFLTLSLTACASTEEDIDNETVEWNITEKQVIVEGCEKLHSEQKNADC